MSIKLHIKQKILYGRGILLSLVLFFVAMMNISQLNCQTVYISEISGDVGNNDGSNDAIVEIGGAAGTNIGCYVISNAEWTVVIPPNTLIPADGVFLIACSQGKNLGSNPNPVPGTGISCSTCDFPNLPIDFDVCDPANAAYIDWAGSGFGLDNASSTDGDQVVLFRPNGTIVQAVQWGGGATGTNDNSTVANCGTCGNTSYTLGSATFNGMGDRALLPYSLGASGLCYQSGVSYTMPPISGGAYTNLGALSSDYSSEIADGSVLQGCNSTFVYNPSTSSWSKTTHPTPGVSGTNYQTNSVTGATTQCATAKSNVTVQIKVNNWQYVEENLTNTKGKIGSFVTNSLSGGVAVAWQSIVRNNTNGETTLQYTIPAASLPSSGAVTYYFVWQDWVNSTVASTPTGSSNLTQVISNSTPSDCYEVYPVTINIVPAMTATKTTLSCPADFKAGSVNLGTLVTGGLNKTYEIYDNGVLKETNSTGVFSIPTSYTGPITAKVTDASGCTSPITFSINNNCRLAPVCPSALSVSTSTASGAKCPGDVVQLCLTGTNLPPNGVVEWYSGSTSTFNPYNTGEGTLITSVAIPNISVTNTQSFDGLSNGTGSNAWVNNSTIPNWYVSGATNYKGNEGTSANGDMYSYGVNGATERALGSLTSGSISPIIYGVKITNTTGQTLNELAVSYTGEQWRANNTTAQKLAFSYQVDNSNALTGVGGTGWTNFSGLDFTSINNTTAGSLNPPATASISGTITGLSIAAGGSIWLRWTDVDDASFDHGLAIDDFGAVMTSSVGGSVPCYNYTIPANSCNNTSDDYIKAIIKPLASGCTQSNAISSALHYTTVCPTAILSGNNTVCAPSTGTATLTISNATASSAITGKLINLNNNALTTFSGTTNLSGTATLNISGLATGEYNISEISIATSCTVSFSGTAFVQINAQPTIAISGFTTVCPDKIAQIPLTVSAGTLPLTIAYSLDGVAQAPVEIFSNTLNVLVNEAQDLGGNKVIILAITSVKDANGCVGTATGTYTINLYATPTIPSPTSTDVCYNGTGTMTLNFMASPNGVNVTLDWYSAAVGGTLLQSASNTYTTMIIPSGSYPQTITYYVESRNTSSGCISTTRTPISLNIYPAAFAEAGTSTTICASKILSLSTLGASITGSVSNGIWTTSGTGTFNGSAVFSTATTYTPSQADISAGYVTLTLTSNDPPGSACLAVSDTVIIYFNQAVCGEFPWIGN